MAETTTVDARTPTTFTITEPPPIARIMKLADAYALAAMAAPVGGTQEAWQNARAALWLEVDAVLNAPSPTPETET